MGGRESTREIARFWSFCQKNFPKWEILGAVLTLQALLFRSELMLKSKEPMVFLVSLPISTGLLWQCCLQALELQALLMAQCCCSGLPGRCTSNLPSLSWGIDGFCWQLQLWFCSSAFAILKHFWRKCFSPKRLSSYILKKRKS